MPDLEKDGKSIYVWPEDDFTASWNIKGTCHLHVLRESFL